MKVGVLLGGTSAERDVSIVSGLAVTKSLKKSGFDVLPIDCAYGDRVLTEAEIDGHEGVKLSPPDIENKRQQLDRNIFRTIAYLEEEQVDVVFNGLHGGYGENGYLQALLTLAGISYTGSGPEASVVGMDKDLSKLIFRENKVPVAPWEKWTYPAIPDPSILDRLKSPLVIKPNSQGSTVGLTIVTSVDQLEAAVKLAYQYDSTILAEQFIPGRELTVTVLEGEALPTIEIIPESGFYDYESKYQSGKTRYEVPAKLTREKTKALELSAVNAFRCLNCYGYARMDYRMSDNGDFYCLEANTLPGMTSTSLVPKSAAAAGIHFDALCERLIRSALQRPGTP